MEQKELIKEKIQPIWDSSDVSPYDSFEGYGSILHECIDSVGKDGEILFEVIDGEDARIYATTYIKGYNVVFDMEVNVDRENVDDLVDTVRGLMQAEEECKKRLGV